MIVSPSLEAADGVHFSGSLVWLPLLLLGGHFSSALRHNNCLEPRSPLIFLSILYLSHIFVDCDLITRRIKVAGSPSPTLESGPYINVNSITHSAINWWLDWQSIDS